MDEDRKLRPKCFTQFDYKAERCCLCFARIECMIEYYKKREKEAKKEQKYHREPGEEICWECLGNRPPHCFGTYMNDEYCEECPHILDCKDLTDISTGESIRDTGKYKGRGKHRKKDIA